MERGSGVAPGTDRRSVYRHAQLIRVLAPTSIALVGASPDPDSFGATTFGNLKNFAGEVFLVNPKYDEIHGRPCYPSVSALPRVPDCVAIAVARTRVEAVLQDCARMGAGGAIIFASGYAETGKVERRAEQAALVALARQSGLRVIGPNCIGIMNYAIGAPITFSRGMEMPSVSSAGIGIASQSGAMGNAVAQASRLGVSISHMFAAGNSCDVDTADYVAYLAEDPACRVIVCIFEGLADPLRFIEAARLARAQSKPIVVYKVAIGEQGAASALSHTGVLAGSTVAWQVAFERVGAIVVKEFEAIAEMAAFLAKAGRPKARGVGVAAGSGGFCVMCADTAADHGIVLAQPQGETAQRLRALVPEFGVASNPCDVTAQNTPRTFHDVCDIFLGDVDFGAVVVPYTFTFPGQARMSRLLGMQEAAKRHDKIVCLPWSTAWTGGPGTAEVWAASHVAPFGSVERCFTALGAWHRWDSHRESAVAPRLSAPNARTLAAATLTSAGERVVTERLAKQVLSHYGIPVVEEVRVASPDEAVATAERLGYPVVLKVDSPDLPHKTEAGAIALGLRTRDQVRDAHARILESVRRYAPKARISGVLVQRELPPGVEIIVGSRVDPLFGALIVVGFGGVLVEVLNDTVAELAPVSKRQAAAMLARLKGRRLLDGVRGAPAADVAALAELVCRVSELAADLRGDIAEIDVNPVIASSKGVTAVDALLVCSSG